MDKAKILYDLIEKNNTSRVSLLVTNTDLANLVYKDDSLLVHAVRLKMYKIVSILLERGAEQESKALMVAVMNNDKKMVSILLDAGFDPYKPDSTGETVFDYFNYFNVEPEIQEIIKSQY